MAFVRFPDARLSVKAMARPVDDGLRETAARLLAAQREAQSYGLAAAHIGETEPVVVINIGTVAERNDQLWFNPQVIAVAGETEPGTEGSVSLPGIEVQVLRPVWAEFGFDNELGEPQMVRHEGFAARVGLHEIEQMNGVFFLSNLSRLKRDMALKKFAKSERVQQTGPG